jgi:hypothetical protein
MPAKLSFISMQPPFCALQHAAPGQKRNAGTKPPANIALNPYKQTIFPHERLIKNLLVQRGINAM